LVLISQHAAAISMLLIKLSVLAVPQSSPSRESSQVCTRAIKSQLPKNMARYLPIS